MEEKHMERVAGRGLGVDCGSEEGQGVAQGVRPLCPRFSANSAHVG